MDTKRIFINTIGCQMNVYDSRQIISGLIPFGYSETSSIENADLIILNTCSVREKAQEKAFSFLGRLAALKKKNPNLIIGVGGCVAQQEGKKIFKRVPFINIVFGTRAISRLPQIILQIEKTGGRIVDVEMTNHFEESGSLQGIKNGVSNFVTIMRGCDNYCTYCVVPYVRGRETSRSPESIINDIKQLIASGTREITLLGQNVNSFGKKEKLCSFPELLSMVNDLEGLFRIRFTTSHPKDLSDQLIDAFRNLDKLCNHIHLPIQSGSSKILKKMNRQYNLEQYLEKISRLRKINSGIAVTSDMIVGFPGETGDDFKQTLNLIKSVEFDGLFAFMYSDRPYAKSTDFPEKVPEQERKERLQELLKLQEDITLKKNQAMVGRIESILVEGESKKQDKVTDNEAHSKTQWTGRTSTNKIVNFTTNICHNKDTIVFDNDCTKKISIGELVNIRIEKAFPHSLSGKPDKPKSLENKGEKIYAA